MRRSATGRSNARLLAALTTTVALLAGVLSCAGKPRAESDARQAESDMRRVASSGVEPASGHAHPDRQRFTSMSMGVVVEITVDDDDPARARRAARAAQEELERLDWVLSDWKERSELTLLNRSAEAARDASEDLRAVLTRALEIADATDGRFDPTVGPLVALWRQTRRAGGFAPPAAQEAALSAARARVGFAKVSVTGGQVVRRSKGVEIDFGGIGKGYGAVRALEVLREHGCPRALVAVAGDIAAGDPPRGEPGWVVRIDGERAGDESIVCANEAVSTSGASVQWIEIDGTRYAHIVDPRTGLGATGLAQVTVVGPLDCAVDALSTALSLCGGHADGADEIARILRRFPGYRARVEHAGVARWLP